MFFLLCPFFYPAADPSRRLDKNPEPRALREKGLVIPVSKSGFLVFFYLYFFRRNILRPTMSYCVWMSLTTPLSVYVVPYNRCSTFAALAIPVV
jgi:hypothetical protein